MKDAITVLTPDAPKGYFVGDLTGWFWSLLPADACRHRCCIGIPDEPEPHINVSWSGWKVQQVGSWFEISSARTMVVTRKWARLPEVVAILRVLGALPTACRHDPEELLPPVVIKADPLLGQTIMGNP